MSFFKTKGFKYLKNLIIGVGAAVVLMGALFKIESWPYASEMLILGLTVEACLFLMLGLLGPDKDYYWEKLYPGLDDYHAPVQAITAEPVSSVSAAKLPGLNGEVVEQKLGGMLLELQGMSRSMMSNDTANNMLGELQGMSKNLGALKSLQEIDFSGTGDQIKKMSNFYVKLNEAMADIADTTGDIKVYKNQIAALNKNLGSLNNVYGSMLNAMANIGK